jgi:S-adenosylmethionine uptake transporter
VKTRSSIRSPEHQVEFGMMIMFGAMTFMPLIDIFAKLLGPTVSGGEIAWARMIVQSIVLAPFVWWFGVFRGWRNMHIHAIRGTMIGCATLFFFGALKYMPLADTYAIFFVEPMILTFLSAVFLKEKIGWRRITAIIVGFIGALIVIRPSWEIFGWTAVFPLMAALCFATFLLFTKIIANEEHPITMQFFSGLWGSVILGGALYVGHSLSIEIMTFTWPTLYEVSLMITIGLVGCVGHILVINAMKRAPASVLAPFQYLEIVTGTTFGVLIFDEFPAAITWLGISIIIGSGMYIFYRESKLAQLASA